MADNYKITFSRSAKRELGSLDNRLIQRIIIRIESLASNPRPDGCRKIRGGSNLWRIRAGDYRIIYSVDDNLQTIDIVAVRHRREAYR
jgi:mRNA interferase RelE/StbE